MDNGTKDIIRELCIDLETELDQKYPHRYNYQTEMHKYNADMDVVIRARKLIEHPSHTPLVGVSIKMPQYCRCDEQLYNPLQDCGCAFGQCAKGLIV